MSEDTVQPNPVSQERLDQFAGTLHYHLKMLGALIPWMIFLNSNGPTTLSNACLESYLTHARLLIEFIAGRPDRNDPMNPIKRNRNPADLQPKTFALSEWVITVPNYFDAQLKLMDKHLSHLSLERAGNKTGRKWAVDRIASPLLAEYGNFADLLRARGNIRCAVPISTGVSEAVVLMNKPVHL